MIVWPPAKHLRRWSEGPVWAKLRPGRSADEPPLRSQNRTHARRIGWSHMCHLRKSLRELHPGLTHALRQTPRVRNQGDIAILSAQWEPRLAKPIQQEIFLLLSENVILI